MITREKINEQASAIIDAVRSFSQTGRIRFCISIVNPTLGREPIDFARGCNVSNDNLVRKSAINYGDDMPKVFEQKLREAINNKTHTRIIVTIKDGGNTTKGQYEIALRDEYDEPNQSSQNQNIGGINGGNALFAQGSLDVANQLIGSLLGGLGLGGTENSGLGAVIGFRDQILRNEYERRDMERQHKLENDAIREEYERKRVEEEIAALKAERDRYKQELEQRRAEFTNAQQKAEQYAERVEELEKMKPEASFMGVALTGLLSNAIGSFAKSDMGTRLIGKALGGTPEQVRKILDGVDEEEQNDETQQTTPDPQVEVVEEPQTMATPIVEQQ
ncbi:MAG: hypothetical protein E7069_12085 [Bacteroidales bacterium]|nr:hypothetical protein [Bacteroidales bacterium]